MTTHLLIATCEKHERFIPAVRDTLKLHWPTHPPATVLTDGRLVGEGVYCRPGLSFVALLHAGLERLGARSPVPSHVYLMLEDLCPLWPVDMAYLARLEAAAVGGDLPAVHMLFKPRRAWPRRDFAPTAERIGGVELYRWSDRYVPKNALVATLWQRAALASLCKRMLDAGVSDPWTFEAAPNPASVAHRVATLRWPTVKHGFLRKGALNPRAVRDLKVRPSPLRDALRREFCGATSRFAVERAWIAAGWQGWRGAG